MRRRILVLCLAVLAGLGSTGAKRAAAAPARPRLVVLVAVDGLSWSRLEAWRPWLTAGLKRLLDEGAVATACRYPHLDTETGPGHASIATGTPPRVHGIALNQWYVPTADGGGMTSEYCAADASPRLLRVPTVGDALVGSDPRAKVVSISIKDRAAILLAGRDPRHAVYWYTSKDGTFATSGAYDAGSPAGRATAAVVARFNAGKAGPHIAERYGTVVRRLPVPSPPPAAVSDDGIEPYQDPIAGRFPMDLAQARKPLTTVLPWTTLADRLLVDLGLDLVADDALALGRDEVPDLLAISFSANDYASHYYGPESVEALEVVRGLDVELGRLLDDLTRRLGKDAFDVVLSADHGMLPLPEDPRSGSGAAARIKDTKIVAALNAAVDARLGLDPKAAPVYRLEGSFLWLDRAWLAKPGAPAAARVIAALRDELATTWKAAIERTIAVDAPFPPVGDDETLARAWNAIVPGRSGDLLVIARPGVLIDPYDGTGTSHGTPWDYDTHVPLIFWGGGIAPSTLAQPSTPYDIAPTIASWIGIALPDAAGTRIDVRVSPLPRRK
ncbi:MAG TPA: alkaline phosphatase family protein [Candidatus Polarisedimenticolaceae bacterium]|nr:alkaline phosphatase family protein [Candidatus Polarisedimenticolaceae bacterium]